MSLRRNSSDVIPCDGLTVCASRGSRHIQVGDVAGSRRLYCLAKPFVAAATLVIADEHNHDVDSPVDFLDIAGVVASFSLRELLLQQTPIAHPSVFEVLLSPQFSRDDRVRMQIRSQLDGDCGTCYSEYAVWWLLRAWMMQFGQAEELVTTIVRLSGYPSFFIGRIPESYRGVIQPLRAMTASGRIADMMTDIIPTMDRPPNEIGLGGYVNIIDLHRFVSELAGEDNRVASSQWRAAIREIRMSLAIQDGVFGIGDLAVGAAQSMSLGVAVGSRAFGSIGPYASSFIVGDPEGISIAACSDVLLTGIDHSAWRRSVLHRASDLLGR